MCSVRRKLLQQYFDQTWFKLPTAAPGGFLNGTLQLLYRHLPNVFLLGGNRLP